MITRGTTPTIVLTVTDFELKDTDVIHLYFSQGNKIRLEKVTPDVRVDSNKVMVTLTQEDTFKLKKGEEVKMRFRLKTLDGVVFASGEAYDEVDDVDDKDEVI